MSRYRQGYKVFSIRRDDNGRKRRYGPYSNVEYKAGVGVWTPDRKPRLCVSGWHLYPKDGPARILREVNQWARELWLVEYRGKTHQARPGTKIAAQSIRLIKRLEKATDYP